jgi:hypothetical protein
MKKVHCDICQKPVEIKAEGTLYRSIQVWSDSGTGFHITYFCRSGEEKNTVVELDLCRACLIAELSDAILNV